jgi:hypothetical protein
MQTYVHLRYYLSKLSSEWDVSDRSCRETQNTYFVFNNFFRKSCLLWDKVQKYGRARQAIDENIIRCIRYACWITEATNTHCEYVILITFQWQHWLRECTSVLRLYVRCLSFLMTFYGSAQKEVQRLPVSYFQCLRFLEDDWFMWRLSVFTNSSSW